MLHLSIHEAGCTLHLAPPLPGPLLYLQELGSSRADGEALREKIDTVTAKHLENIQMVREEATQAQEASHRELSAERDRRAAEREELGARLCTLQEVRCDGKLSWA